MKLLLQFLLALLLSSVQASLLRYLGGGAFSVSLVLPGVVYLGLRAGMVDGAVGAAAMGYVLDVLSGGAKGLLTFLSVLLFLFSRLVGATLDVRSGPAFAVLSGLGTFLVGFGAWLLTRFVSASGESPGGRILLRVLVEAVVTGLAAPMIGWLMQWIDRLLEREEPGLLR